MIKFTKTVVFCFAILFLWAGICFLKYHYFNHETIIEEKPHTEIEKLINDLEKNTNQDPVQSTSKNEIEKAPQKEKDYKIELERWKAQAVFKPERTYSAFDFLKRFNYSCSFYTDVPFSWIRTKQGTGDREFTMRTSSTFKNVWGKRKFLFPHRYFTTNLYATVVPEYVFDKYWSILDNNEWLLIDDMQFKLEKVNPTKIEFGDYWDTKKPPTKPDFTVV